MDPRQAEPQLLLGGLRSHAPAKQLAAAALLPPLSPKPTGFAVLMGGVAALQQNCGHGQPNLITTAGAVGYLAPVPCNKVGRGGRMARGVVAPWATPRSVRCIQSDTHSLLSTLLRLQYLRYPW